MRPEKIYIPLLLFIIISVFTLNAAAGEELLEEKTVFIPGETIEKEMPSYMYNMKQLIEKGLEDGTISQEQAQILMRKPKSR